MKYTGEADIILQVIKNRDKSKVEEVVQASLEGWKKYIFPV